MPGDKQHTFLGGREHPSFSPRARASERCFSSSFAAQHVLRFRHGRGPATFLNHGVAVFVVVVPQDISTQTESGPPSRLPYCVHTNGLGTALPCSPCGEDIGSLKILGRWMFLNPCLPSGSICVRSDRFLLNWS